MAGKLSQSELETFYDISASFDEYDPGLDAFSNKLDELSEELNSMGGRASLSYRGVIAHMNDQWEHHDEPVRLTGKLYLPEEGFAGLVPEEWDGPYNDRRGTYYVVEDEQVVSVGITDAMASSEPLVITADDDTEYPVALAYGFSLEDIQNDTALFVATPNDLLQAKYDTPTYDAVVSRLFTQWPKIMRYVDTQLDAAGSAPERIVRAIQKISERVQPEAIDSDQFSRWLLQYLQRSLEFDYHSPYIVTFEGDITLFDPARNEPTEIHINKELQRSLLFKSVSTTRYKDGSGNEHVDYRLLFDEPTPQLDEEGISSRVLLNPRSITSIRSTRPVYSLMDAVMDSAVGGELQVDSQPEDVDIEIAPYETKLVHRQIDEARRLERLESTLANIIKMVSKQRGIRHYERQDAMIASGYLAQQIVQDIEQIGLGPNVMMRVDGGVYKALADLDVAIGSKFHLNIDNKNPVASPTIATDTVGRLEKINVGVDKYQDEDGTDFWVPAPRLHLLTKNITTTVAKTDEIDFIQASVRSYVSVNLDGTAAIELPHLAALRRRRIALAKAAVELHGTRILHDLKNIDRGLMSEHASEPVLAGKRLTRAIRRVAVEALERTPNEVAIDTLRDQLSERLVRIDTGERDANGVFQPDSQSGALQDLIVLDGPGGPRLMAAIDRDVDPSDFESKGIVLLPLDSLTELVF